jgi:hypothetical protein
MRWTIRKTAADDCRPPSIGGFGQGLEAHIVTETLRPVVVPYADFLERRQRRLRITAELGLPSAAPAGEAETAPVAAAKAGTDELNPEVTPPTSISAGDGVR